MVKRDFFTLVSSLFVYGCCEEDGWCGVKAAAASTSLFFMGGDERRECWVFSLCFCRFVGNEEKKKLFFFSKSQSGSLSAAAVASCSMLCAQNGRVIIFSCSHVRTTRRGRKRRRSENDG